MFFILTEVPKDVTAMQIFLDFLVWWSFGTTIAFYWIIISSFLED